MLDRASVVIDHDFRDRVERYCNRAAFRRYCQYYDSPDITPWGLVSVTVTLEPGRLDDWRDFLVDDAEGKRKRFAEIVIDPSIVNYASCLTAAE